MKSVLKNKKGFTLVELLAVIVILALIMGIAVISMSGVIDGAKKNTMKSTASQIIEGVRSQLTLSNETEEGYYYFTEAVLQSGGKDAPLGGTYAYINATTAAGEDYEKIGTLGVYRYVGEDTITCSDDTVSYVHVTKADDKINYEYAICLTAGAGYNYINTDDGSTTEQDLLDNNNTDMIKEATE